MGIDCSNCRCANREDEKILVIETNDKIINPKGDTRKEKLELEKVKSVKRPNINEILDQTPGLIKKIIKMQSLIRRYRDRKTYKVILKKFRVSKIIFIFLKIYFLLKFFSRSMPKLILLFLVRFYYKNIFVKFHLLQNKLFHLL
jgi:hypothetical protein